MQVRASLRIREFDALPYLLPERALPKIRGAWEFATLLCCGKVVALDERRLTLRCPYCGIERRVADMYNWDTEFNPYRIIAERYFNEKRGLWLTTTF